tara:strand:+ start:311 stop:577 length:267 start_codon:yes stop_codon:yes gene_type:complete
MNKETQNTEKAENGNVFITDVRSSAIEFKSEQVVLMVQFDEDDPIECLKATGDKFTLELKPLSDGGSFVSFTGKDGKTFKMSCVKHYA